MIKKSMILFFVLVFSGFLNAAEEDAKKLSQEMPKVFWYAATLWGKEPRGVSMSLSLEEFTSDKKTKFKKLESKKAGEELWMFQMYYEEDEGNVEEESWTFVFSFENKKWVDISGKRATGGIKTQLLEADAFTSSLRPHIRKALDLYQSGELDKTIASLAK